MTNTGRPNILLLFPDQQRYDCLGRSGNPLVQTPNLDKLASEGMWFNRAYTPIPTCCPARQSLLSGQWAEVHGCYWNYDGFLSPKLFDSHTWTEDLRTSGYRMGYVGKWHVHPDRSPTEFGFEWHRTNQEYAAWRKAQSLPKPEMDEYRYFGGVDTVAPEQTKTHWYAERAIEAIRDFGASGEPWHLRLDFDEPHLPCVPAREFLDLYREEDIEPWGNFGDSLEGKPHIQRQQLKSWNLDGVPWERWRTYVHRYLGIISQIDDAIGRVLRALEESGQADNTIVVYTSDHGDAAGSHGMIDKHYVLYEEEVHVPMIVRWPGVAQPGSVCDGFVSNCIDLASTFCDTAGVAIPDSFQGRSMLPLLKGETPDDWPREAFSTYNGQQFGLYTQRMIRDERWKYVWNMTDVDELYDMESDPWELTNLAGRAEHAETLADMRKRLLTALEARGDRTVKAFWAHDQLAEGNIL